MISQTHPSWHKILEKSISNLSKDYQQFLKDDKSYFPDKDNLFNAFKLPLDKTRYILFGQDPYPREQSAIGYSFIDGKVTDLFCENGLCKDVNRATSLRNFIKMVFVCEGKLSKDLSKEAVAKIDKTPFIKTIMDLKDNFEKNGVLLLNMALVFTAKEDSKKHIKAWNGFVKSLLFELRDEDIDLILFGKMAEVLQKVDEASSFKKHTMPHPYNISFITDKRAEELFSPMHLLSLKPLH
jgi:uracil-DNA glycosylase